MLQELFREYRTGSSWLCSLIGVPQFARVVAAVESAEQAVQAMCSLIRVSFERAQHVVSNKESRVGSDMVMHSKHSSIRNRAG